jgi:hypothetical protein
MYKTFGIISFILCLLVYPLFSQQKLAPNIYMVKLTDKGYNSYSLSVPGNFLSARAIERRTKQNLPIEINDLPVSQLYIDSLTVAGFNVLNTSKWLNAAIITIPNDTLLPYLSKFSFIIKANNSNKTVGASLKSFKVKTDKLKTDSLTNEQLYGTSYLQLSINNGQFLHNNNYKGKNVLIAVLDGGFTGVLNFTSLEKLRAENRIVFQRDIVDKTGASFYSLSHGANVLSIMAGVQTGSLVGTAPEANYALIRTEDAHIELSGLQYEYPVEEFYWVVGAELADSIGADVINSSLGYNEFNDSTLNHTYKDMDGKTTLCTQGANIASSKGMIVVVSAGNEGSKPWTHITAPADADNILTVGAINNTLQITPFSSRGPSADLRVKPDVVALGQGTYVQAGTDYFSPGSGTSFAAPVITGLTACLWQANPNKTSLEVMDAIRKSASQYSKPDSLLGYGIPNFEVANSILQGNSLNKIRANIISYLNAYPNPCKEYITIDFWNPAKNVISIYLSDLQGKKICNFPVNGPENCTNNIKSTVISRLSKGTYLLNYQSRTIRVSKLIVKQ